MSPYLLALLITIAVEVPIVAMIYRPRWLTMALTALVATTATHLTMHFVLPLAFGTYASWLIAGEVMALVVEAAVYWLVARERGPGVALVASAVANMASFGVGVVIM